METTAPNGRNSFQWKPLLLVEAIPFQWKPFLLVEAITFSRSQSPQWKPFILMETITHSGRHSFQWKPFPLVEAVRFSVNCFLSFQWKPFLQRKSLAFSGSNFFQWKLLVLIDGISFIGSYSFYWKPFILMEAISYRRCSVKKVFLEKSLPAVETNLFRRSLFFLVEAWWKLLLLIETFPFSGSHSFQCFNIFTSRSYQKLSEYLNINDSVRSLKMANCYVFAFLEKSFRAQGGVYNPVEHLAWKVFEKIAGSFFFKKAPSQMCDWVLNTPLRLFFHTIHVLLEFQYDH